MENMTTATINDIVTKDFRTAAIFEKHSLDFCCGGGKTIAEACREKAVDADLVLDELKLLIRGPQAGGDLFAVMELDALVDHIVATHHAYVRSALPAILKHTRKVADVHGARHSEVVAIADLFNAVAAELSQHMIKEEQILFPYIKSLVAAKRGTSPALRPPFGSIENPIRMMELEHQSAGNGLYDIRALSFSYAPPEDACTTYKVSYLELDQFERDLHTHVHLENNILFPKAIKLEKELFGS
jgi:regulator of cell morphogenesis and NO signaling